MFLLKKLLALVTTRDFASIHLKCEFPNTKWKLIPKWENQHLASKNYAHLHTCNHYLQKLDGTKIMPNQNYMQVWWIFKKSLQKYLMLSDVMFHIRLCVTWSHCVSCHDFFSSRHICHFTSWHEVIWWHVWPWVLTCLEILTKKYLWSPNHYLTKCKVKLTFRFEKTKRILRMDPPKPPYFKLNPKDPKPPNELNLWGLWKCRIF